MDNRKKKTFKQRLNNIKAYFKFKWKIILLYWANSPRYQRDLERGSYYIRRGNGFQVGQPFRIIDKGTGKIRTRYIDNIFFNFKTNSTTHKFSDRPIKGLTEKFKEKTGWLQ